MIIEEHIETSQDFLEESEYYFDRGDVLQGSEKTWGAAAHIVMAMAQQRGWSFGDHRSLKIAVRRLADEHDDPYLVTAFGVAEKFHANFYHKFMQDYEYSEDRPEVRRFVERIQSLMAQE